jgi:hypothetical protein
MTDSVSEITEIAQIILPKWTIDPIIYGEFTLYVVPDRW